MVYIRFDDFSKDVLAKQKTACYNLGLLGNALPSSINTTRLQHVKQVGSLETSDRLFAFRKPSQSPRRHVLDLLDQERKWVAHYDACIVEHNSGKKKHSKANERTDFSNVLSFVVAEALDTDKRNKATVLAVSAKKKDDDKDDNNKKRSKSSKQTHHKTDKQGKVTESNTKVTMADYIKRKNAEQINNARKAWKERHRQQRMNGG